jgi:hypothetical protein
LVFEHVVGTLGGLKEWMLTSKKQTPPGNPVSSRTLRAEDNLKKELQNMPCGAGMCPPESTEEVSPSGLTMTRLVGN